MECTSLEATRRTEQSGHILKLYKESNLDELRAAMENALAERSLYFELVIDLAKSCKDAANLVKELISTHGIEQTELADKIADEIIGDIERYIEQHLDKYQKFTLNAPQMTYSSSMSKFFNLISLLKDVSILGRKLLEASPRFESCKSSSTGTPTTCLLSASDRKSLLLSGRQKDSKSQMSEDDATSEDLLAALIESSSSDDFLVLSSSLESITVRDMILTSLILITSHDCFTLSHDIQGVVMVLRRTKFMIKNILAPNDQMELVAKLLTAISRYNEMNYVFDLFRDRNQFELLLSKGVEKTPELRIALFNYAKKNPEFYALVTLNFSMFREIADSLEASAMKRLDKLIQSRKNKLKKAKKKVSLIISSGAGSAAASVALASSASSSAKAQLQHPPQQREQQQTDVSKLKCDSPTSAISSGNSSSSSAGPANTTTTSTTTTSIATATATATTMKKSNSIATSLGSLGSLAVTGSSGATSANANATPFDSNSKPLYSRDSLNLCLVELVDASDCFAKAGCYKRSNDCERKAKLIALQLALLPSETNLLDLQQSDLNDLIVSFESFLEAHIVAEAYEHHLSWRQALFRNVVLRGQAHYLDEYLIKCDLSPALVLELVLLYKQYISNANNRLDHEETCRLARSMRLIIERLDDVELKCKLFTQLNFHDVRENLLQKAAVEAHLRDLKLI